MYNPNNQRNFQRNRFNQGYYQRNHFNQGGYNQGYHQPFYPSIPDQVNQVSYIPKEGDTVYTNNHGSLTLGKRLGGGKEGSVYSVNDSHVVKIFSQNSNTTQKVAKLKQLIRNALNYPGICAPIDLVFDSNGDVVGYLMEKANGVPLTTFISRPVFLSHFPNWKKRDVVQLALTILDKFNFLHSRGILMGDASLENLLVTSSTEVYFVDVDSYQIGNLPCTVGRPEFSPPELMKFTDYHEFLRNKGNENFSIAVLIFYLMVLGQHPYKQPGNMPIQDCIKGMLFPYPLGALKGNNIPPGPWRYMWSHLPSSIKKALFHTFTKGGEFSRTADRLSAADWIDLMQDYLHLLDSGKLGAQDKMSEEIYPTRFKKQPGTVIVQCSCCGNEADEKYCYNGVCMDCRRKQSLESGEPMVNPPLQRVGHIPRPFNPRGQMNHRINACKRVNKIIY